MHTYRRAALAVLVSFGLAACAPMPATQSLNPGIVAPLQPVDVKIGIAQPELYAAFEHSTAGAGAAAACGAVPGLGILLAAACGGALGAVDASVNESRAKTAEELVRPLKDEVVDVNFDKLMSESLTNSLHSVPGMQFADVAVTKTVNDKAYDESFRAATTSAVMYVNVDYHMSTDFSTLEVSARALLYPRSASARTAAGQPAALPADSKEPALVVKNSVYRANVIYQAKQPVKAASASDYIAAWKADGGRALRAELHNGATQVARLLAEDLQRAPGFESKLTTKVDVGNGIKAGLLAKSDAGELLRFPDGSLHFNANLAAPAASAETAPPIKASAAGSTAVTALQ